MRRVPSSRPRRSILAWSAAAPTATPASRPTRRSASRPTCSSRRAARPSSARRPRSTAPSTCSPAAPSAARSARSSSSGSSGGSGTPAIFGAEINNNPSPGNKEGGLTTIYEKSLGAIAKAGSTALVDVVGYAEPVDGEGLRLHGHARLRPVVHDGPRRRRARTCWSSRPAAAACFGCKPTPCIKVATNTPMYERMIDDMDINAGTILEGAPVEEVGREIFEKILAVAAARRPRARPGVGEEEFARGAWATFSLTPPSEASDDADSPCRAGVRRRRSRRPAREHGRHCW